MTVIPKGKSYPDVGTYDSLSFELLSCFLVCSFVRLMPRSSCVPENKIIGIIIPYYMELMMNYDIV